MQLGSKPQGSGNGSYTARAARPADQTASAEETATPEEIPTINLDEEQEEVKISDVPFNLLINSNFMEKKLCFFVK